MIRVILIIARALMVVILVSSCEGETKNENQTERISELESRLSVLENEIAERDNSQNNRSRPGMKFNEVRIGDQVWMTENLNVDRFRNGELIPHAKMLSEWEEAGNKQQPAWCYFNNDPSNSVKFGKLYNWFAINDPRGIAPEGWHVPSDLEWGILVDFLGGENIAGTKMKSSVGWADGGNGTNESGFTGLPGGSRHLITDFNTIGYYGSWWSSTENSPLLVWDRFLSFDNSIVNRSSSYKVDGYSVRCLRD